MNEQIAMAFLTEFNNVPELYAREWIEQAHSAVSSIPAKDLIPGKRQELFEMYLMTRLELFKFGQRRQEEIREQRKWVKETLAKHRM